MTGTTLETRWRPTPGRFVMLIAGLWLFGTGDALLVASELGNSPWTVLSEGLSELMGLSIGVTNLLIGVAVLLAWLPLRQRMGLGTIMNVVVISIAIDVTLRVLPRFDHPVARGALVVLGTVIVAIGSGLYLAAALGPGPRDGLMTGLHRVTGVRVGIVRAAIEIAVLTLGALLGGTVGFGTVFFALAIGPLVDLFLGVFIKVPVGDL